MKWRELSVVVIGASLAALCACTATVTGSGSAGPTPAGATATRSKHDAPPYRAPRTVIGNPRTVDLCSGISPGRFARFGDVSPTFPVTPVECWFWVTPPGAESDVRMTAYVYGEGAYGDTEFSTRTVAGQTVYFYPFAARYCRAMIATADVAIGVEADDRGGRLPEARVCAMRDALLGQMLAAVNAHRLRHREYVSNSLTGVKMCDHLNDKFTFSDASLLELLDTGYGNGCSLVNDVYSIDIWVGLQPPPVRPGPDGKLLNLHGHEIVQPAKADPTYCEITAQQDLLPGAELAETIRASAEIEHARPGLASGDRLCADVAGEVVVQFLQATGRI